MHYVHIVAMVAVLQYIFFSALVGRARGTYGVKAPAVVGHEMFERAYRVQMNTLELLVAFIPALYVAAHYWAPAIVAGSGAVYVIGRFIYWRAYVANPSSRQLGFVLSMLPVMGLALAALVPAVIAVAR
ncbi:MAPEG family protein [Ideonella sp. DXS29W]|uniref:MAPEG family protein n=1 Tax=Ideonella lacteola TaxID=2984193 RepID=A0ABU9BUS6_9BURK